jgi:hypothetical protein
MLKYENRSVSSYKPSNDKDVLHSQFSRELIPLQQHNVSISSMTLRWLSEGHCRGGSRLKASSAARTASTAVASGASLSIRE